MTTAFSYSSRALLRGAVRVPASPSLDSQSWPPLLESTCSHVIRKCELDDQRRPAFPLDFQLWHAFSQLPKSIRNQRMLGTSTLLRSSSGNALTSHKTGRPLLACQTPYRFPQPQPHLTPNTTIQRHPNFDNS